MDFDKLYERYENNVKEQSGGLVATSKADFLKIGCYFGTVIQDELNKTIEEYFTQLKSQLKNDRKTNKSIYELVLKRDQLKSEIDILSGKTNNNFGRDSGIWDVLTKAQNELENIEEELKNVKT
jgi:hypothetical protein